MLGTRCTGRSRPSSATCADAAQGDMSTSAGSKSNRTRAETRRGEDSMATDSIRQTDCDLPTIILNFASLECTNLVVPKQNTHLHIPNRRYPRLLCRSPERVLSL